MIAWNIFELLVEIKLAGKKNGPIFGPNWPKSGPKIGFVSFFQVWFIGFGGNCTG